MNVMVQVALEGTANGKKVVQELRLVPGVHHGQEKEVSIMMLDLQHLTSD